MALQVTLLLSVTAVVLSIVAHNKDPEIVSSLVTQGLDGVKKITKTFNHYYETYTLYVSKYLNLDKFFPYSEEGKRKDTPKINAKDNNTKKQKGNNLILSKEELMLYNGEEGSKGLYVGILGSVFDVEIGKAHYGPGGGYHFFAGKDGSRAFISGDFTETGLIDDVSELTSKDLKSLHDWYKFYLKDYTFVGKVVGNFYDEKGKPTAQLQKVLKAVKEVQKSDAETEKENRNFPPCNIEWSKERGSRVWCTTKSGGIDRSWAGVPRRMVKAGGKKQTQCVCVEPKTAVSDPRVGEYEDCPPGESSCWVAMSATASSEETMNAKQLLALDFEVFGLVQGVFFRKYTAQTGKKLGLRGWCMNTHHESVLGKIEGEKAAVEEMKHWLRTTGSPSSRIDKAEFRNEKTIEQYTFKDFSVHH